MSGIGGYRALVRLPHAAPLVAWSSLARLQFGVLPLAMLLLLADVRSSYAEAGAATAAYGLTAGLLGPLRARAADRFGHGRVLVVLGVLNAAGIGAVVLLASAPLAVLVAASLVAGSLPGPVGPVMRAAWRDLTAADPASLRAAFALDSVAEEVLYVVGPLVTAVAIARFDTRGVIAASAGLLLLASCGMAFMVGRIAAGRADDGVRRPRVAWRSARFLLGLLPAAAVGLLLGGLELAAVAAVLRIASERAVGVPAALISVGSIVGGLVYGRRRWPGSVRAQAAVLVLASAAAVAAASVVTSALVPLLVLFLVAGLFVAPSVVASYVVADASVTSASAESTSWVNASFNVGTAFGAALAGVLVDGRGPAAALWWLAVVAAALTGAGLAVARGRRTE